jgi:prophage antirepressor-like protein
MNELSKAFQFQNHAIRVIEKPDGPEFVARDVCDALGISNVSHALSRLTPRQKGIALSDTLGGRQEMVTVTEPGLYRLVIRSDKEEADKFIDWLCHEVIPEIRKTGRYGKQRSLNEMLEDPRELRKALFERIDREVVAEVPVSQFVVPEKPIEELTKLCPLPGEEVKKEPARKELARKEPDGTPVHRMNWLSSYFQLERLHDDPKFGLKAHTRKVFLSEIGKELTAISREMGHEPESFGFPVDGAMREYNYYRDDVVEEFKKRARKGLIRPEWQTRKQFMMRTMGEPLLENNLVPAAPAPATVDDSTESQK